MMRNLYQTQKLITAVLFVNKYTLILLQFAELSVGASYTFYKTTNFLGFNLGHPFYLPCRQKEISEKYQDPVK